MEHICGVSAMCETFSSMLGGIVTIVFLPLGYFQYSKIYAKTHRGFMLCQLSKAEITFLSISFSVWFWVGYGHTKNLCKWRCLHVYALKVGAGHQTRWHCSHCRRSAGSAGTVRVAPRPTGPLAPPHPFQALGHVPALHHSKRHHLLLQGDPAPRLPWVAHKDRFQFVLVGSGFSLWVPGFPRSCPHSSSLPSYSPCWPLATSGSTGDVETAAQHWFVL